jgi:tetratricopeptide (TPR) repeat protein
MNYSSRRVLALAVIVLGVFIARVSADDPLAEAREFYAAAAYEDALAALAKVEPTAARGEAEQYRAFCLIALGRTADAARAIEAVVAADPLFVPRPSDVPPRILAMFTDVRRRVLPDIAQRAYLDGRSAFQAKDFGTASKHFEQATRVIDQASVEGVAGMDDLKILVSGFVDLARASSERPSNRARAADSTAMADPSANDIPDPRDVRTGPIVIRQDLPAWNPPNAAIAARPYSGAVKVLIGADGTVHEASIVKPVHPLYDQLVLEAAQRWTYQPATRLGEPTAAEKIVEIRLTPR